MKNITFAFLSTYFEDANYSMDEDPFDLIKKSEIDAYNKSVIEFINVHNKTRSPQEFMEYLRMSRIIKKSDYAY